MTRMLYLIGAPGSGKSTLMRQITAPLGKVQVQEPVPHVALYVGPIGTRAVGAELGVRRADFAGTDALAMNAQPKVMQFLEQIPYGIILAEGDRLANGKFFDAVRTLGISLHVVEVWAPPEITAARRAGRGGRQDARWVRGRETKVARLSNRYSAIRSDSTYGPGEQVGRLRTLPGIGTLLADLYGGLRP